MSITNLFLSLLPTKLAIPKQITMVRRGIKIALLMVFFMSGVAVGDAQNAPAASGSGGGILEKSTKEALGTLSTSTQVPDLAGGEVANNADAGRAVRNVVNQNIFPVIKKLMIAGALVLLSWAAIMLLLSHGKEEELKKKFTYIVYIMGAFIAMGLAVYAIDYVFFGTEGQILTKNKTQEYAGNAWVQAKGVFDFVTSFAVISGVLMVVIGVYQLLFGSENPESWQQTKRRLVVACAGIVVLAVANRVVNYAFPTKDDGSDLASSAEPIIGLIAGWANNFLGLVALLSVVALVAAGIYMIVNFGDEEQVNTGKKICKSAVIALLLSFSAWVLVRFFI